MQKLVERFSIRWKLNGLVFSSTGLALFIAFVLLKAAGGAQYERTSRAELLSLTRVIGQAAEASLFFNDTASAKHFLNALEAKTNIISATIVQSNGELLASYTRPGADRGAPVTVSFGEVVDPEPVITCSPKQCISTAPVKNGDLILGHVVIVSDLSQVHELIRENGKALLWTFVISLFMALLIAGLLQRIISRPLVQLAKLASRVSTEQDYSLRLEPYHPGSLPSGPDEISSLVSGFNYMLEQIERRDQELITARESAEAANRAKTEFVANTSHELRTPINNILGFTEMLAERVTGAEEQRLVDLITVSANSLLWVINDILDISKIEAGRLELTPSITNLREHIIKILEPLSVQATEKGLDFELDISPRLPESVFVDGVRLGQVLLNLVSNAVKFTESPGRVYVAVDVLRVTKEEVSLRISVSDSGVGIPAGAEKKIFEPFRQADASTSRKYGGTGLGLAISASIMRMMGGGISVWSKAGEGSTFSISVTLPRGVRPGEAIQEELADVARAHANRGGLPIAHVLVVEDNPFSREIVVHRLEHSNFRVTTATNGYEAVEAVKREEKFDLILMDCQMPGMDGFEATREIRKLCEEKNIRIPIVALTAHAMEGYRDVCVEAGMDDYITKPIRGEELIRYLLRFAAQQPQIPPRASACAEAADENPSTTAEDRPMSRKNG